LKHVAEENLRHNRSFQSRGSDVGKAHIRASLHRTNTNIFSA
jgi:hypothetical protein